MFNKNPQERFIGIIVLVVLIGFFLNRLNDIYIPYCSDEMDVYARGVLYMYDHMPSLLPGDIPPDLSRGHPLLFYFLGGLVFKIFGPTLPVAHVFALCISMIWCSMVYVTARKYFSPQIGLSALLVFICQPMVISQSTMLLPEVLLALLTLAAIYFLFQKRIVLYSLFASLALLTKESGIVLPALVLLIFLAPKLRILIFGEQKLRVLFLTLPFIIFLLFLVIQKVQNGWFFFPLHTHLTSFTPDKVVLKLFKTSYFFIIAQGKYVLSFVFILSLFFYFRNFNFSIEKHLSEKESKILFFVLFISSMVVFSVVNFYNNRYYLLILAPLYITLAFFLDSMVKSDLKKLGLLTVVSCIPFFFYLENKKQYNLDVDLGYKYMVYNQLDFIDYLKKNNYYDKKIFANSPFYEVNLDPRFGYVNRRFNFTNEFDGTVEYVAVLYLDIFNYWEPPKETSVLVKTFTKEFSTIKFYKIKRPEAN